VFNKEEVNDDDDDDTISHFYFLLSVREPTSHCSVALSVFSPSAVERRGNTLKRQENSNPGSLTQVFFFSSSSSALLLSSLELSDTQVYAP